jgi:hypothetical protein
LDAKEVPVTGHRTASAADRAASVARIGPVARIGSACAAMTP